MGLIAHILTMGEILYKEYYRSQALNSRWDISFNLCSEKQVNVCNETVKYACQTNYDSSWVILDSFDLGSLNKTNFIDDGVTLTYRGYISPDSPRGWCSEGALEISYRITDFNLLCDKGVENVDVLNATQPIGCYYNVTLKSKKFCECPLKCSPPHGKCVNGECVCDQFSNGTFCENLIITIDSVTNTTINGGIGYIHFSNFYMDSPIFQLKIGGVNCTNVELLNTSTIQFSIGSGIGIHNVEIINGNSSYLSYDLFEYQCNTNCSPPHGKCNIKLGSCWCDTQTNGTNCENSTLFLINIDSTDENGGTTYLYGYFGITTSNLSIMIGDNYCINIEQLNETLIKCDVGKGSGFKDVILKDRDLTVNVLNLFQYFKPITTDPPKQCIDNCGAPNNGICTSSGCVCISPWIGNDCKSKIILIPQPSLNYSNPITDILLIDNKVDTKLFRSLISIVKLRELDFQSKQVNSFTFIEWEYFKVNESTNQYKSNITNLGLTTFITVTLQWFENETNVVFANQNIKMNPSSIKYTIEISEYKFRSNLNQLQLVMMASLSVNKTNDICSNKEFSETSSGDDSNYLKIQIDDHSLYGRFIKRALIDSIPRSIDNVPLDSSMNQVDSSSLSQSYIGISVPYFKKQIIIDPDFSVLLSSSSDSFKSESSICSFNKESKFSGGLISAIVLCSFFVFASLVAMVLYHYYKKRYDRNIVKEIQLKLSKRQVDIYIKNRPWLNKEYYRSESNFGNWEIRFNLCSEEQLSVCDGLVKYTCQTNYYYEWEIVESYDLGSLNKTNFIDDGVTLTYRGYISPDSPRGWCSEGALEISYRITNFNLLCDKSVENVYVFNANEPIGCYYNVTIKTKKFCQCPC
ncbi:hypothetical protein ACTFIY_001315 [Dictyostelium cf. discoideum]